MELDQRIIPNKIMTTVHQRQKFTSEAKDRKIIVRKAIYNDIGQLVRLFNAYRVFYGLRGDIEKASVFLSERLTHRDSEIFVAESGQEILAGFVQLYPLFSSTRMKRLWLLNDLYVDDVFRGQHISIMLIDEAKKLATQTNSAGLILETAKSNAIGNELYPRTGFKLDREHNYYSWDGGA